MNLESIIEKPNNYFCWIGLKKHQQCTAPQKLELKSDVWGVFINRCRITRIQTFFQASL